MELLVKAVVMILMMVEVIRAEQETCVKPIDSLLDCLAYAQGKDILPSTSCCTNVNRVFQTQKKCLCELIAVSFDGGITGLPPFNPSLALTLPSACGVPADPSECPGLLGIPTSSSKAKEFEASKNATSTSNTYPIISSTPSSNTLSTISSSNPIDNNSCLTIGPSLYLLFVLPLVLLVSH